MVVTRYQVLPDERKQDYLLSKCAEMEGLIGLVLEILKVETPFQQLTPERSADVIEAIVDQLTSTALPKEVIWGRNRLLSDYAQAAREPAHL